eukprot:TRINITY_DN2332_c0_g1_i2.p1 TRINITY_DN2332_c0_g1~~TRINITY_DN2332_c0_g1_i2.p1  ORF type:complete len:222 (-),score=19.30 TRINITY_DN2332_c0_g1_i2:75-740(-)
MCSFFPSLSPTFRLLALKQKLHRKAHELIEVQSVFRDKIPVIKRFSGGGTVIVDRDTVFVTLICNRNAIPNLQPYPRPIMSWTEQLYSSVFHGLHKFRLRENDYVLGDRKFGGNAQSITKDRWLHHTSFLWDFKAQNMGYLKLPSRSPKYRVERSHNDFLIPLKEKMHSRLMFLEKLVQGVSNCFCLQEEKIENVFAPANENYKYTTKILSPTDLKEPEAA